MVMTPNEEKGIVVGKAGKKSASKGKEPIIL